MFVIKIKIQFHNYETNYLIALEYCNSNEEGKWIYLLFFFLLFGILMIMKYFIIKSYHYLFLFYNFTNFSLLNFVSFYKNYSFLVITIFVILFISSFKKIDGGEEIGMN
ncbi:hypothetical protein EDI_103310 [Entamoeba dispar SAW760]|uniref:Uncharacterized protein n=1 Tax=Entamoeba dispar (strain ATCC PRA-260 / SAW760) TaxID=370354 RepID=B0ERZ0_ENTDS|nr:uncharacterized protein EDI_103310 [Entamoeba dispar SAW760]EDR22705.1 hypothetical protein EDI_103310 [Entamoeba dispar SAW760]|eukprot:EDR22705.1 hypothetical protein EDI_103310 [Entamoeba dispar SAW760]